MSGVAAISDLAADLTEGGEFYSPGKDLQEGTEPRSVGLDDLGRQVVGRRVFPLALEIERSVPPAALHEPSRMESDDEQPPWQRQQILELPHTSLVRWRIVAQGGSAEVN